MSRLLRLLLLMLAAWTVTSCQQSDEPADGCWEVTALLTPNGLGDMGYNDQMYLGFCMMREELGCDVMVHFPTSAADAGQMADAWHDAPQVNGKHRLLVLCDESYAAHVKQMGWTSTPDNTILQLDSEDESLPIYTRYLSLYGGCQAVGRQLSDFIPADDSRHAAVVLANPHDKAISEGREGFLAGAKEAGVEVDTYYLSDVPGGGYVMADSLYHLCYDIAPQTAFVLPLAGASNNGVYRYGREKHEHNIWSCVLDSDLAFTSYSSVIGIYKRIDLLLRDFSQAWQTNVTLSHNATNPGNTNPNTNPNTDTTLPFHASYDLSSGYITVEILEENH